MSTPTSDKVIISFSPEEKLTHYLLLNAALMPDLGVLNGRMKAVIHFLELSKQKKEMLYEDFAMEMLDEIIAAIKKDFPICFGHGLCGIGWGIEHMIKKRLLAVDEDVCEPYDKEIARYIRQERYEGIGLYNGLTGILLYLLARIENYTIKSDSSVMAGNKKQINLVIHAMFTLLTQNEITKLAQEKDNPEFSINLPLIYSKWEYPILLQALGTTYLHGIQPGKVTKLLECLLLPFNIASNFPKSKINKQILLQGLVYLSGLRIHPISSRLSQLAQTLEFELKTKHKIPTT